MYDSVPRCTNARHPLRFSRGAHALCRCKWTCKSAVEVEVQEQAICVVAPSAWPRQSKHVCRISEYVFRGCNGCLLNNSAMVNVEKHLLLLFQKSPNTASASRLLSASLLALFFCFILFSRQSVFLLHSSCTRRLLVSMAIP